MFYNDFKDTRLSALGLGCMRLPLTGSDESGIDEARTQEMVDYALENGINYFDTAWGYHGHNSEIVIGKCLKKHPRDSFYLATKFPGYDTTNMGKAEEIFEEQLKKCQVDYFDFYLFHNVCEKNIDLYLDPKYKVHEYLTEQKKNGRIKHLGFSCHGDMDVLKRFVDAYGDDLEFCQLQINYIDWSFQQAKEKAGFLKERGIELWVMEPVRGGKLAKLSDENSQKLKALRPDETDVDWAFRFIQTVPAPVVTLSGMSDMEQLKQNIELFSEYRPLNETELEALNGVAKSMLGVVPCTACRYCTEYCPMELDIPMLLALYNEHKFTGGGFLAPMRLSVLDEDKKPSACIGCRSCENVCPQQIKISEAFADFVGMLNK